MSSQSTGAGMSRRLALPYAEALTKTKAALRTEGFGVLTEIDVRATLQEKIGVDFREYTIIGACNPPLAHRALQSDLSVGLLLPCNVIVYADGDGSVVSMFDPEAGMALAGSPALDAVAHEARERLQRALASIE
ncbi:MAG: DUF302 domain-containing protein [Dehalococcoidia bacterium]|nr:MAG: DUF302 domain-containing protein [Dehalococcoidia bacterium]